MIKSMTGFGSGDENIPGLGKVSLEIRSVNHKFLEVSCHFPDGFSYLEDKIKKEVQRKIGRGRVICLFNILAKPKEKILINKHLLKDYYVFLNKIKGELKIKEPLRLEALINLPGVLDTQGPGNYRGGVWAKLRAILRAALSELDKSRAKEGRALYQDLRRRSEDLKGILDNIKKRFKKVIKEKSSQILLPEEKASFLKSSDISEEITRMRFHIINFGGKLNRSVPVGKELDFISQELSREANTMGAKSIDAAVSADVVEMKSQIEKIREQLQNVE